VNTIVVVLQTKAQMSVRQVAAYRLLQVHWTGGSGEALLATQLVPALEKYQ
jgi:hypothetical protein